MGNVCAVIVTYGNRFNLVRQVIESCLNNNVYRVIIVDNASSEESRTQLKAEVENNPEKIMAIHLRKNIGSAGGFKKGIEEALRHQTCEYILLLDDDNVVLENCISILVDTFKRLEPHCGKDNLVLSSYRINLSQLDNKTVRKGVFLGFHIKDIPKKLIKRLKKSKREESISNTEIEMDTAPWGGLFFHKDLIQRHGFPNDEFVLYSDDTEFTYRIRKNGGKIFFVDGAKIIDINKKMGGEALSFNVLTYLNANQSKIYYGLRNTAYFEVYCKRDKTFTRKINKLFYITMLAILSIIYRKKDQFQTIIEAIRDGEIGRLGYNEKYPL